jgi:hypothetical protein
MRLSPRHAARVYCGRRSRWPVGAEDPLPAERAVSEPASTLRSPDGSPALDAAADDPDLLALPAPPKRERTATVVMMVLTAIAALWMAIALFGEARYVLAPGQPEELGDLTGIHPAAHLGNRYVRASAPLGTEGAIRYGRAAEGDSFRLAPVAGNPKVWIEIRVPEGLEGPRFVPPTSFAGRLVPFRDAGLRHASLATAVHEQTNVHIPSDAWILIDGSSPRASRWALALAVIFIGFAVWNLTGVARVLKRVRDATRPNEAEES